VKLKVNKELCEETQTSRHMAGRGRGKGGWGAKSEIQKLAERQDTDGSVLAELRQMGKEPPPLYPTMEIPEFVERSWEEIQQQLVPASFRLEETYRTWPYRLSFENPSQSAVGNASIDKIARYSDRFQHEETKWGDVMQLELLQNHSKKRKRGMRHGPAPSEAEPDLLSRLDQHAKLEQQETRSEALKPARSVSADEADGEGKPKKEGDEGSDGEADSDDGQEDGDNDGDYAGNYFDNGEDDMDDGDDDDEPVM